ncbi:CDP-diacylglycerol--serine O-phosphatidyltransferase [Thermoflexibacter ruber]|uniref:CDP-diacylglycerol--serine O-phosphatidyltransferase n=1 Tax=Thermoflexibacter ruber TaxID=1003 RepID=A0A1I2AZ66_9BACT|nr:CDP-diacylglycerol--serine O-phosphatidyltransferase [Thermoflexibacter ruber]SFE49234.1 CDP-diacylglycerol---serine O-phosphatidyltransferase [Thermoflexibacter ruber]
MRKHIPNLLTCGNLLCGFLGITFCFEWSLAWAANCILIAVVFDFFDGFAARSLKVSSPIGKELDSLADVVSFGVLPALILYKLVQNQGSAFFYFAVFIAIFSALRLAKFNVDTRQSDAFIGVPTPANALLIASFPLIYTYHPQFKDVVTNLYLLYAIMLIMPLLLVAELPLIALKFKTYDFAKNKIKYILVISSVILLIFLQFAAIPLIIVLYVLLSILNNLISKG